MDLGVGEPVAGERGLGAGTGSSTSMTRAPVAPRTLRASACAQTAPNMPVLAPITATGLLRSALSGNGRDAQSSAFLSWPGSEELYSGVAIRTASAVGDRLPQPLHGLGRRVDVVVLVVRRHVPQPVEELELARVAARACAATRRSRVLWEPRRRLPEIASTRMATPPSRAPGGRGSVTSFSTAKPPLGSGAFQLRPNSVRSTVVESRCRCPRLPADVLDRPNDRAAGLDGLVWCP